MRAICKEMKFSTPVAANTFPGEGGTETIMICSHSWPDRVV